MKMPFGKYKGKEISELSYGYISTLLEHVDIKDQALLAELEFQEMMKGPAGNHCGYDNDSFYEAYDGADRDDMDSLGLDFGDLC